MNFKKITLKLKLESGIHVGSSSSYTAPRGIDSETLKTPQFSRETDSETPKLPEFPLSSFKGKLRSSAEMLFGKPQNKKFKDAEKGKPALHRHECDSTEEAQKCEVCSLFGSGNIKNDHFQGALVLKSLKFTGNGENEKTNENKDSKNDYFEIKIENTISRLTGEANPRIIERTQNCLTFTLETVLLKEELLPNLKAILSFAESSNFGGNKSRGYGKVCFGNFTVNGKKETLVKGEENA